MQIQCPSCRKINDEESQCKRCGCDLAVLRTIIAAADNEAIKGADYLLKRNPARAMTHARRSWRLKHNVAAARVAFLASVALGHFHDACRWHERARNLDSTH